MESILDSIKKLLGISKEDTHFDMDIIMHINSAFADLNQIGVGPSETFVIEDDGPIWSDFTEEDNSLNNVRTYVYLSVKLIFDPPTSSFVLSAMERKLKEAEWRLNVSASNKPTEENDNDE